MNHLLPTQLQTILLKACLFEKEEAIQYFNQWIEKVDIDLNNATDQHVGLPQMYDSLDFGSQRLLGLLYYNLTKQTYSHPIVDKLKGYYKYIWFRNQVLNKEMHDINAELQSKGIDVIFFKGVSIVEQYYPHFGTRPTVDLDVVFKLDDRNQIDTILKNYGWEPRFLQGLTSIDKSLSHAVTLRKGNIELDLHYSFSQYKFQDNTTKIFWELSAMNSMNVRFLSPANELYCVLLHAFQWNPILQVRWVSDCVLIIKTFQKKDWMEFSRLIEIENYNSILKIAFDYLSIEKLAVIPEEILKKINNCPIPNYNFQKLIQLKTSERSINDFAKVKMNYYLSKVKNKTLNRTISGIFNHYKYLWGINSNLKFVKHIIVLTFDKILNPKEKKLTRNFYK